MNSYNINMLPKKLKIKHKYVTNITKYNLSARGQMAVLFTFALPVMSVGFATMSCVVAANVLCKFVNVLPVLSITAGIYTMVVISVERVRCVLPARGHVTGTSSRSIGKRGTIITLAVIWMLSVVIVVPDAIYFNVGVVVQTGSSNNSLVVCHSTWNNHPRSIYSLFLLVVSYLLPQAVIYINYGRVAAYLWNQRLVVTPSAEPQAVDADAGSQTTRHGGGSTATPITRSTLRSIKMLVTTAILFLVSWAPYFTILTLQVMCMHYFIGAHKCK